jgi:hypothetical protein
MQRLCRLWMDGMTKVTACAILGDTCRVLPFLFMASYYEIHPDTTTLVSQCCSTGNKKTGGEPGQPALRVMYFRWPDSSAHETRRRHVPQQHQLLLPLSAVCAMSGRLPLPVLVLVSPVPHSSSCTWQLSLNRPSELGNQRVSAAVSRCLKASDKRDGIEDRLMDGRQRWLPPPPPESPMV